jgi:predicted cupin superfamily sugar epimerase
MYARAAELIASLGMRPHPEGGYYREIYRSASRVQPLDSRPERAALTTIYFLLAAGDLSGWHRVASDEVWHHYEGDALELHTADANFDEVATHVLGTVDHGRRPVHVVQANAWQAARSMGAYTLVGCTVGPGFDFADFELLRARPIEMEAARRRHPDVARFV